MNNQLQEKINKLNPQQKEAMYSQDGCFNVLAAAGSGKSQTMCLRIARLIEEGIDPSNIMVVTFTNKAKQNMIERLEGFIPVAKVKELNIGTFHSLCYAMLREQGYLKNANIIKPYQQEKIIGDALNRCSRLNINVQNMMMNINNFKNDLKNYNDDLELDSSINFIEDEIRYVYRTYEEEKAKLNLIDFGDMILKYYDMIMNNRRIKNIYQDKFKYITIDESQDTNNSLMKIVKILSEKHNNVFFVGDIRQSIYGFLKARPENIENLNKYFSDVKTIDLYMNYRSTSNIVNESNRLMEYSPSKFTDAKAFRGNGEEITYFCEFSPYGEAETINKEIKELYDKKNNKYKDIAILTRTNSYTMALEEILSKNSIPYEILGGISFYERKEIKDLIAYMEVIQNKSSSSIERIINVPNRYLGKAFVDQIKIHARSKNKSIFECMEDSPILYQKKYYLKSCNDFTNIINKFYNVSMKPYDILKALIEDIKYIEYLNKSNDEAENDRAENVKNFLEFSKKFNSVDEMLEQIHKIINKSQETNKKSDKVQIMTIHKSKGLEFKTVFLTGVHGGNIPHYKSVEEGNVEEELRVMYVGMTRPEDKLYVSFVVHDKFERQPSEFIIHLLGYKKVMKMKDKVMNS